jgi:transposase
MRTPGTPAELEFRRRLAVQRLLEGYPADEVADFFDVSPRTVWRWLALAREQGLEALAARPVSGRPPKLSHTQEKIVLRWLRENPTAHGFPTELWTAPNVARLIEQELGVTLNPRYLSSWLRDRDITPQKPERAPREGDPEEIRRWLASDWPRIKKSEATAGCSRPD